MDLSFTDQGNKAVENGELKLILTFLGVEDIPLAFVARQDGRLSLSLHTPASTSGGGGRGEEKKEVEEEESEEVGEEEEEEEEEGEEEEEEDDGRNEEDEYWQGGGRNKKMQQNPLVKKDFDLQKNQ